jgi:hypothetical protein
MIPDGRVSRIRFAVRSAISLSSVCLPPTSARFNRGLCSLVRCEFAPPHSYQPGPRFSPGVTRPLLTEQVALRDPQALFPGSPSSWLLRPDVPVPVPLIHYGGDSLMRLCSLSHPRLATGTFPTCSLRIFLQLPGPLPRLSRWCTGPLLPTERRPSHREDTVGTRRGSAPRLQGGALFRGCRHALRFRPLDVLATPVAPPDTTHARRAAVTCTSEPRQGRDLPSRRIG